MTIQPDFNQHFSFPTVYDDINFLDKEITIKDDFENLKSFTVVLQPFGTDANIIKRAKDIQAILQKTHNETQKVISLSLEQKQDDKTIKELQLEIKSVIENYRSLLDYTAHYIAQKCNPIPSERKTYFPIASKTVSEVDFTNKLKKDFPNLESNCKEVFDYLIYIQHFNNDYFLSDLNDLVNEFKHRGLPELEVKNYKPIIATCGNIGVRIGELGFNSIEIQQNGKLIFEDKEQATISGPCKISLQNYNDMLNIDNLNITQEEYNLLTPKGSSKSITGLLWTFSINILRVINNICIKLK